MVLLGVVLWRNLKLCEAVRNSLYLDVSERSGRKFWWLQGSGRWDKAERRTVLRWKMQNYEAGAFNYSPSNFTSRWGKGCSFRDSLSLIRCAFHMLLGILLKWSSDEFWRSRLIPGCQYISPWNLKIGRWGACDQNPDATTSFKFSTKYMRK